MKRYKIESGGAVWTISSDRKLSRDEIVAAFVEDLKQGRAPDCLGSLARVRGPGFGRFSFIVIPYILRDHGLITERECQQLCVATHVSELRRIRLKNGKIEVS